MIEQLEISFIVTKRIATRDLASLQSKSINLKIAVLHKQYTWLVIQNFNEYCFVDVCLSSNKYGGKLFVVVHTHLKNCLLSTNLSSQLHYSYAIYYLCRIAKKHPRFICEEILHQKVEKIQELAQITHEAAQLQRIFTLLFILYYERVVDRLHL